MFQFVVRSRSALIAIVDDVVHFQVDDSVRIVFRTSDFFPRYQFLNSRK